MIRQSVLLSMAKVANSCAGESPLSNLFGDQEEAPFVSISPNFQAMLVPSLVLWVLDLCASLMHTLLSCQAV